MDKLTASLVGVGILAVLILGFFLVSRGKGKFSIKTPFGGATAEGPPPKAVPGGVKISGKAGRDIHAQASGDGGVDVGGTAGRDIKATHTPGDLPPKT